MMVLEDVGLEPESLQNQEFLEKSCGGQLSGDSLENHKFMENIGLAWPMFSMNFWIFLDFGLVPSEAKMFIEFWCFIRPSLKIIGRP